MKQFELYDPMEDEVIAGPVEARSKETAAMKLLDTVGYEVRPIGDQQVNLDGVKFICPDCKGTRLECCEDGAYNSEVLNIDSEGDFDFGEINASGQVERFQCLNCGYVLMGIADGDAEYNFLSPYSITEHEEIVEWCKENCKQE